LFQRACYIFATKWRNQYPTAYHSFTNFVMKRTYLFAIALLIALQAFGQNLPDEIHFSVDGKRLITGGNAATGLYDEATLDTMELVFGQANYATLLTSNYASSTPIPATLIYKGKSYDSVGVNYKGFTSYSMNTSQKKSFNIGLDWIKGSQDIKGYKTLNLNCNFEDQSAMHEVLYNHVGRNYIPGLKSNYTYLKINGQPWAVYANTQQLDDEFIKEWFLSDDGARWRCIKPTAGTGGPGGGGTGGPFGTGYSTLNYLGADTTVYKDYYTLKSSGVTNPWDKLRDATAALNNMSLTTLADSLGYYIDVDKATWFLAHEIAWADDDSYVFKGGMDYFAYFEPESGLLFPLEFDGNSAFWPQGASWSPFYRETDVKFPLCNKMLKVPAFRQRYLAHMRTILADHMVPAQVHAQIDTYKALIDNAVQNEPKKIYTYAQFTTGVTTLKTWVTNRAAFLNSNAEVAQVAPTIADLTRSVNGMIDLNPTEAQTVDIKTTVSSTSGISSVWLHYSPSVVGRFEHIQMYDDGAHNDGATGDGVYGATIPAFAQGTWVRYYVEARADNTAKSCAFFPKGAEHDVFIYNVQLTTAASDVVINEVMAANITGAVDELGEHNDWVELYNKGNATVDISTYRLSDDFNNLNKWKMPAGVSILPGEYLILWADEDSSQGPLHMNFKLSKTGEQIYMTTSGNVLIDSVAFGLQTDDKGYARRPNGTGSFVIQNPTFKANNDMVGTQDPLTQDAFRIFPNPTTGLCNITSEGASQLHHVEVTDAQGRMIVQQNAADQSVQLDLSALNGGLYFIRINQGAVVQKIVILR
jgi:CotH kinase protein/Lamin Tail Domain/Secretion system C-terminal sorting domain